SRTLDEYKAGIDAALQDAFGVSVDESLYGEGIKAQRDLGLSPLAMAHLVGTRLELTPVPPPSPSPAGAPVQMGLVANDGMAWLSQPEPVGKPKDPTAQDWSMRP
ncbi:hypothetical protein, partial [Burkholderia sola]|uniref:hypothetical protein n=1 Tax=Burkholderia sola TaxID=2843302 RepID=UPI00339027F5